jgi:hypothetical protein
MDCHGTVGSIGDGDLAPGPPDAEVFLFASGGSAVERRDHHGLRSCGNGNSGWQLYRHCEGDIGLLQPIDASHNHRAVSSCCVVRYEPWIIKQVELPLTGQAE